ncbi:hypothetical protein F4803DRAFT_302736 [Xylaria telfairii]|nr:hypothetical protein F4803DRAFT_302736 [Xylaria telfairii]
MPNNPITHPVNGSVILIGQLCAVEWNPITAGPVSTMLYTDRRPVTIASSTSNDGWYSWTPARGLAGYNYSFQTCDLNLGSDECSYISSGRFQVFDTSEGPWSSSSCTSACTTSMMVNSNSWTQ